MKAKFYGDGEMHGPVSYKMFAQKAHELGNKDYVRL